VSSGQANAALTKYKPQLAVFELANYLTFGGTKASDIISPSATVSDTVSLLTDVVKDQFSGTNNVAEMTCSSLPRMQVILSRVFVLWDEPELN
jgi:hypothetical protein